MYAVVKFLGSEDEEIYSEIPSSWLTSCKKKCFWPPNNSRAFIEKYVDPRPNWKQYPIKIDGFFDTLEEARKVAVNLETSEEDSKGRGKRRQTRVQQFSPEMTKKQLKKKTSVRQDFSVTPPPSPPPGTKTVNVENNDTLNPEEDYTYHLLPASSPSHSIGIGDDTFNLVLNNISEPDNQLLMLNNISEPDNQPSENIPNKAWFMVQFQDIIERLDNIEKHFKEKFVDDAEDFDVYRKLPLKSVEEIKEVELLLNDDESIHRLKSILRQIGGTGLKDNITRILRKIFTDECAVKCSWLGHRNNFKIGDLKLINVIFDSVNYKNKKCDLKEFELITRDWLRHAKQRKDRAEKKN